jgi:hypothetical protein
MSSELGNLTSPNQSLMSSRRYPLERVAFGWPSREAGQVLTSPIRRKPMRPGFGNSIYCSLSVVVELLEPAGPLEATSR